jgi:hypothetical protein
MSRIRTQNEYRPTINNSISKLLVKKFNGSCEVLTTQVPYLKKHVWWPCGNTVATLINDVIVEISDYVATLIKSHYLVNSGFYNTTVP